MPLTVEEEDAKLALTADDLRVQMTDGMVGCIGRISMDGTELPKTGQGFRMFNAAIGCEERTLGPCLRWTNGRKGKKTDKFQNYDEK